MSCHIYLVAGKPMERRQTGPAHFYGASSGGTVPQQITQHFPQLDGPTRMQEIWWQGNSNQPGPFQMDPYQEDMTDLGVDPGPWAVGGIGLQRDWIHPDRPLIISKVEQNFCGKGVVQINDNQIGVQTPFAERLKYDLISAPSDRNQGPARKKALIDQSTHNDSRHRVIRSS